MRIAVQIDIILCVFVNSVKENPAIRPKRIRHTVHISPTKCQHLTVRSVHITSPEVFTSTNFRCEQFDFKRVTSQNAPGKVFCTPLEKEKKKSTAVITVTFSGLLLSVVEFFAFDLLGDGAEAPGRSLLQIELFSCFFAHFLP